MRKYYLGILFITYLTYASSSRSKRFSDYDARDTNEWNWVSRDQMADAQTPQVNWPKSGNGGSIKGKGHSNPNRDDSWPSDTWTPGGNRDDGSGMGWNTQPQGNNKGSAYPDGDEDQEGDLETILKGVPGMDFPNFVTVPDTDFDCSSMPSQGYYGDVEAGCQVFHICQPGNRKDSFLCPVGTIFNQKYFVCDWWFNVNCSDTPSYYELNNEVYKDPAAMVTEEVPVTTEKNMPWNSQDLDRKKPTKSRGNQPPTGKQNPNWKGTPARRGSKSSGPVSTSKEMSNTWSRSDVQKEITLSWGASSSSPSETYASSSTPSNTSTAKPIWYDIDGKPAKDQSNGASKRVGLMQNSTPFGTRIRKTKDRSTSKPDETTILPITPSSYKSTTDNMGNKGINVEPSSPVSVNWEKIDDIRDSHKTENGITWNNDVDYDYATTKAWAENHDIPEILINPTGIQGVWEQQTRNDIHFDTSTNPTKMKGVWEQQRAKTMDSEISVNPTGVKEIWKQQIAKRMDPETSINPTKIKGVWEQQTARRMDSETSINPIRIKEAWKQQITKRKDPEFFINPNKRKGVWEQQTAKRMDPETSINPPQIKGVWKEQTAKRMDSETSINPVKVKGIWEHQTAEKMEHETVINPSDVKGVWEQQIVKRTKSESTISPTVIKENWKQQSARQPDEDHTFNENMVKNKDVGMEPAHTGQNRKRLKATSNQTKELNQRRKFRNVQSSTTPNRGRVQNRSQKQKALGNSNKNTIVRLQNWK